MNIGLTKATFSHWTDTTVPREATLYKIADYLNVTVEQLLAEDEPTAKEKRPSFDERSEEFATLFNRMTPEQREIIIAQMKAIDGLNRGK
jgi:transcriptional regulator with XRE-family HTH domain